MQFRYRGYPVTVPVYVYTRVQSLSVAAADGVTFPLEHEADVNPWIDYPGSGAVSASDVVVTATFQAASDTNQTQTGQCL